MSESSLRSLIAANNINANAKPSEEQKEQIEKYEEKLINVYGLTEKEVEKLRKEINLGFRKIADLNKDRISVNQWKYINKIIGG